MANSPGRAAVDVGSVIAGTYKIEALLGRGGMGAVFLASHQRLAGKRVAIKILHTELEDGDIVARFKREAEIAARLNHPNIVGVIDYNVAPDGMPYLVLDYLEGEDLAQRLARGPLPLDQVMSILRQVGSALAAAHRASIVHRDLKPQNIFLVPTEIDGRMVEIAKVLDFGISKIRGSQTVKTQDSALLGTPQYMAPEQAMGQHDRVDERTDVFALGAIAYEMLSGQPAFPGASIPEVVFKVVYEQPSPLAAQAPSAPPSVVAAVTRAMAKQSDERFATVTAFVEAVTGQPLTLTRGPASVPRPAAETPSSSRGVATGEALAQTMGSGDHGESPVDPLPVGPLATAAPGVRTASPASEAGAAAVPAPAVPMAMTDLHDRGVRRSRRSPALIAAIALAGAAIAAGVIYVVDPGKIADPKRSQTRESDPGAIGRRSGSATQTTGQGSSASGPQSSGQGSDARSRVPDRGSDTDMAGGGTRSAGPGAESAAIKGHGSGGVSRATGRPRQTDDRAGTTAVARGTPAAGTDVSGTGTRGDTGGDEEARDRLLQAEAALDKHEYDLAERLASAVINSAASPRQRALARLIHGTVQCVARNDQEAAQIDLRNLGGFRALKARLVTVCRTHGISTGQ
jgi:serine/threonine-protein kinase